MLIGNRKIKEKIINGLVKEIKKKKELGYLADGFVKESLKRYLGQNSKIVNFLVREFDPRAREYKQIIKEVRGELRKVYGLYQIHKEAELRRGLFGALLRSKPGEKSFIELHKKILETHISSRERLGFYEELYKKLFKMTGKPETIVDLGCGLNPFSIPLMGLKEIFFYAYDISDEEINLVRNYFEFLGKLKEGWRGEAGVLDLRQWEKVKKLKKVDIAFLWKMAEVLDRGKGHKVSEMVIKEVPARYAVVSFPTFTVKGERMNQPRRKWIELMCKRLGYEYNVIKEANEIFYVVEKKP